jgi:hypothetical protein
VHRKVAIVHELQERFGLLLVGEARREEVADDRLGKALILAEPEQEHALRHTEHRLGCVLEPLDRCVPDDRLVKILA